MVCSPPAAGAGAAAASKGDTVRYIGAVTCQSSMCHGGASPSRCQFALWSQQDFHSRAYATLVTARSVRIAGGAGIKSATESPRCTVCHAPLAGADLAPTAKVSEGVSCENCHNPAESWLRGHTRPDWTYADRVHAGMSDLHSAAVRAETCVACHQVIDADLLKAGHPELTFELDGQSASEPRHWQEKEAWFGPKAWLVGQATALKEISLKISQGGGDAQLQAQERSLVWLLHQVPFVQGGSGAVTGKEAADWSGQVALAVSG